MVAEVSMDLVALQAELEAGGCYDGETMFSEWIQGLEWVAQIRDADCLTQNLALNKALVERKRTRARVRSRIQEGDGAAAQRKARRERAAVKAQVSISAARVHALGGEYALALVAFEAAEQVYIAEVKKGGGELVGARAGEGLRTCQLWAQLQGTLLSEMQAAGARVLREGQRATDAGRCEAAAVIPARCAVGRRGPGYMYASRPGQQQPGFDARPLLEGMRLLEAVGRLEVCRVVPHDAPTLIGGGREREHLEELMGERAGSQRRLVWPVWRVVSEATGCWWCRGVRWLVVFVCWLRCGRFGGGCALAGMGGCDGERRSTAVAHCGDAGEARCSRDSVGDKWFCKQFSVNLSAHGVHWLYSVGQLHQ